MKAHSMPSFTRKLLPLLTISVLAACGGGGGGNAPSQSNNSSTQYHVAGQAQKGPFIFGSQIWISELDDKLSPSGKVYMTQTKDDLGNFGIPGTIGAKLVELTGSGYYMNELSGTLSTAPVTLNAVADLSVSKSLTINLLTTLQAPRLKALMAGGSDYHTAYNQSRNEVLAVFGIDAGKVDNLGSLFDMRINGGADQDSILLAASAILSQVAENQAPTTETAELSHLISTIAGDLANNGKLSNAGLQDQIITASGQLDLEMIRRNVETYYANRGIPLVAPRFEEWVDSDNSHILPRRIASFAGFSLNSVKDVEVNQVITSNPIQITGIPANQHTPVYVSGGAALVKNNQLIKGKSTTVQAGDTIALQDRSSGFGGVKTSRITIGSNRMDWSISSESVKIASYESPILPGFTQTISANNLAFSLRVDSAAGKKIKYIGITAKNDGKDDYIAQIYDSDDTRSTPNKPVATLSRVFDYFNSSPIPRDDPNNGNPVSFNYDSIQFKLGAGGFTFTPGKGYFLVLRKKDGSPVSLDAPQCVNCFKTVFTSTDGSGWYPWSPQAYLAPVWMAY